MQYFVNYYKLNVTAAFAGCSTETEPSASTIAYLVNKVKEEKIPVVLYTELNDGKVAQVISNEVGNGCQMLKIQSLHNVSKSEFDSGATWVSLMKSNIDVLKKALQQYKLEGTNMKIIETKSLSFGYRIKYSNFKEYYNASRTRKFYMYCR